MAWWTLSVILAIESNKSIETKCAKRNGGRNERGTEGKNDNWTPPVPSGCFCPNNHASLRMLQHQLQRERVRLARRTERTNRPRDERDAPNAAWLFLPNGTRLLMQPTNAYIVRRGRQHERLWRMEEEDPFTGVEASIKYGAWLFSGSQQCDQASVRQLHNLIRQEVNAEELFCFGQDCIEWNDCCMPGGRRCGCVPKEEDERENAMNVRLLFLRNGEEAAEKAEIAQEWVTLI